MPAYVSGALGSIVGLGVIVYLLPFIRSAVNRTPHVITNSGTMSNAIAFNTSLIIAISCVIPWLGVVPSVDPPAGAGDGLADGLELGVAVAVGVGVGVAGGVPANVAGIYISQWFPFWN